jgi:hypothetical protein
MSQSTIKSFFTAVGVKAYDSQLDRDRALFAAACEAAQVERAVRRGRQRRQREEQQRGPGRPRKQRAVTVGNIVVKNSTNTTITIHIDDSSSPHSTIDSPASTESDSQAPSSPVMSSSSPSSSSLPSSPSSSPSSSSSSSSSQSDPPVTRLRSDWLANPSLFAIINAAVQSTRSWKKAVTTLQEDVKTAASFQELRPSTVRSWYEPRSFSLKDAVRRRLEGETITRSGRPSTLSDYPDIEEYVIDVIKVIRAASGTINSLVIHSFFRGFVRAKHPDLLKEFRFTRRWCRSWFKQNFNWSYKKGTNSGQKLPLDWERQTARMIKRVAGAAAQHHITHPCFIINWDQTAVLLMQANKYTYHNIKDKHVSMIGQEEKRQITAVVTSTLDGDLLPLQLIFKGQDKNKQQQRAVPVLHPVEAKRTTGSGWHLTQTANHWSSLESMKDYIRMIVRPWVWAKGKEHGIDAPHCVLLLDCWSVHKSKEFVSWMAHAYPSYHLVFVPAGCTGKAQPADVGLQRPFKAGIVNAFTNWLGNEINLLIKGGTAPAEVKIDTGMTTLKPKLVKWTWQSWDRLKGKRELIKQGWDKCGLSGVLDVAQQMDALRFCINDPVEELGEEEETQQNVSESDEEEETEEAE